MMSSGKHVDTPPHLPGTSVNKLERTNLLLYVCLVIIVCLFGFGAYLGWQVHQTSHKLSGTVERQGKDEDQLRTLLSQQEAVQKCQVELQKLITNRGTALTNIAADDRRAVSDWIARVSIDVALGTEASINDIRTGAYEAFRRDVRSNDLKRAAYGSGIKVSSACEYKVTHGKVSPLPSLTLPPRSSTSLPPLPTVTRTGSNFRTTVTATATRDVFI